ncbi:hypothetical protein PL9214291382 [Planktothrix tepida PCC 9214]|uniref:Uncharacterized protein n=1 Tax=Planktothrix tepida PCC 9214 TaxID=671072 RepID=A0A1J1LGU1_9CYAN|nr:hypothetical protein PL9214291382 [Planktothrix tepida PCC 9214]
MPQSKGLATPSTRLLGIVQGQKFSVLTPLGYSLTFNPQWLQLGFPYRNHREKPGQPPTARFRCPRFTH